MAVKGYHCYWLAGDTKGYAGVGLMSKVKPLKVTYELGEWHLAELLLRPLVTRVMIRIMIRFESMSSTFF
jgi:exonuclease III